MAKTCPSCGYRPIGPFTDNCPMCAEPVRNVRSDGARGGGFGSSPMLKLILGGTAIVVLGVAGCCGLGIWKMGDAMKDMRAQAEQIQAQREAERKARTVVVAAADLLKEFDDDPVAADEKYAGKYLELTGVVERRDRGRAERTFVVLTGGDEAGKLKIECFFDYVVDPNDEARIRMIKKGQTITVRGEYDGRVSNVQVRDCVLAK